MSGHRVFRVSDVPVGSSRVVTVEGLSIGVFHLATGFHALLNRCPHRAAPLCQGPTTGLVTAQRPQEWDLERDGEIVRCPWHGWEFDITTGRSVFNPHRVRTRSYQVTTEPDLRQAGETLDLAAPAPIPDGCPTGVTAPGVDSFPTTVEDDWVIVHLGRVAARATRAPAV